MKKMLFIIILFLPLKTLYGQMFQVGLRTGFTANLSSDYIYGNAPLVNCDKGLYARFETKNGWAFEINASNYNYSDAQKADNSSIACWGFPSINGREYSGVVDCNNVSTYSVNIIPQILITRKNRALANYIGLYTGASIVYNQVTYYNAFVDNEDSFNEKGRKEHYFDIRAGLTNSIFYKINNHFVVNNTVSFSFSSEPALLGATYLYETNILFSSSFGIGYRFN